MSYVPIRRLDKDQILLNIADDRGHAEIAFVVGTTCLIQDQIPINPALTAIIQIRNDVHCISLTLLPISDHGFQGATTKLLTALRVQDVLVRPQLSDEAHVLETNSRTQLKDLIIVEAGLPLLERHLLILRPILEARIPVPMIRNAPDVFGSLLITVYSSCSFKHSISIVIPSQYSHFAQLGSLQGRPEIVTYKDSLLLGSEYTRLPLLCSFRLILHRNAPDRHTHTSHFRDEAHVVPCPHLAAFRA
mmetsp:Transcript_110588/g.195867  ORF Transcript_110588/g.195867 Transcript_110588/m.195867 type:complete len:247 (-) Transcript_110588:556-1296(-)